jgi:hypothetical protein
MVAELCWVFILSWLLSCWCFVLVLGVHTLLVAELFVLGVRILLTAETSCVGCSYSLGC